VSRELKSVRPHPRGAHSSDLLSLEPAVNPID